MKLNLVPLLVASLALLLSGCDRKQAGSSGTTGTAAVKPARQTSFEEVTSQLDPGGSVYGYLATDQWLADLSTKIEEIRDLLLEFPDIKPKDREGIEKVFGVLSKLVSDWGIEDLTGIGVSGVQFTPELHRTKFILHHKRGEGTGVMWNLGGKEPHALSGLDLLTGNTAIAVFGDIDLPLLWKAIEDDVGNAGVPELSEGIRKLPEEFEKNTQLSWSKLLASLGGELGFALMLDENTKIQIPAGQQGIEIPEPGLMLVIKVKDTVLFDRISSQLKQNPQVVFTDEPELKMYAMPLPVPLPINLEVTVASANDYLFVASSTKLVREALAVKAGDQPGLRQSEEARALLEHLPAKGNQFSYVSSRFSETLQMVQQQVLAANQKVTSGQMELLRKLFMGSGPQYGMSVGARTPTGWTTVSVGNQDSATALVAAPVAGATAVGAAMLLPALAKAKDRAQSINCINNMKQIGLAARMWSLDHNDQFCFNVSRAQGGTRELCSRDAEGYDRNTFRHFQAMSNELNTPKILVCPADKSKEAAMDFSSLESQNVTYRLRTDPKVSETNPEEILTYCPIHQHRGYADGSVHREEGNR